MQRLGKDAQELARAFRAQRAYIAEGGDKDWTKAQVHAALRTWTDLVNRVDPRRDNSFRVACGMFDAWEQVARG